MAHGHFLMLAMYGVFFANSLLGLEPYLSLTVTIPLAFLGGMVIFSIFIRPILNYSPINQILVTLGLAMVLENLTIIFFSPDLRNVKSSFEASKIAFGTAFMGSTQIIALGGSIAMTLILFQIIQRSSLGRSIRAAAEDPQAAILVGINVKRVYLLSFALGVTCLGIAAPLLVPLYYISPTIGELFTLTSFVVVVLGGMGNFMGALLGGFIIGMTEAFGFILLPVGSLAPVLIFLIFIMLLLFRPQGLFGGKKR
jgi:branched-chain amino acid transport system permease protein